MTGAAAATELGDTITNVARIAWTEGDQSVRIVTNEATIRVEAERTASTIRFFRHAPSMANATRVNINGSDYAPDGDATGEFRPIGPVSNPGNAQIDMSAAIPLVPAVAYLTGEVMFVRVSDPGQNGNPDRIETVTVKIEASTGDEVTLRLYETGPDTGAFYGYVPSARDATPINDTRLTTATRSHLTATYIDSFDANEVSVDTALVDPFGRVFNALTGELLDGIPVTLINVETGQPADVYGVDGVSRYPSSITTGSRIEDAGGLIYDLAQGEFRFPLVAPGRYKIRVDEPEGYLTSSIFDELAFGDFDGAPFAITSGSYGGTFSVDTFGPISFDIPLDPASDLVVTKSAEAAVADVGDFVRYTITLDNRGSKAVPIVLRDIAPKGFRYVGGSSRMGEDESALVRVDDPVLSDDGRSFDYRVGTVPSAGSMTIGYVMQVGAGVKEGDAYNAAMAIDRFGTPISNIARTPVTIREDRWCRHRGCSRLS